MSVETLVVLASNRIMGKVERHGDRLRFIYDEHWRSADFAYPLSLSMPLAAAEHRHPTIEAFLWGLLPDNERTLEGWARRYQVSARNPFALLVHVGEDCPGAIQFCKPQRVGELLEDRAGSIEWLREVDIAQRLRNLREDPAAWRQSHDVGQFSLAGAQPKTAFYVEGSRIGVPSGAHPTTHIFKPPTAELNGQAENEHFCLSLARALGLPASISQVRFFGDEVAIVLERFDRLRINDKTQPVLRIHQEDCCQALGLRPTSKYQNDGGPAPERIVELIRTHSAEPKADVQRFVDALAFNWLIGGSDAHAKNYSLLLGLGGRVRLAPLYDLASALPWFELRKIRLAMKIGGTSRSYEIGRRHWHKLAEALHLDPAHLLARVAELAAALPAEAGRVRKQAKVEGLKHPVLDRLLKLLVSRAKHCATQLRPA